MATHLTDLLLALGIFATGFIVIGPNILAVISTSMAGGRRAGAMLALGIGLGSGLWASLTVLGLAALISAYAGVVVLLKLFGAAYLGWLSFKSLRSAASADAPPAPATGRGRNMVLRGLTIQMTNPKAALQWIAIVAIGLGPQSPLAIGAALVLCATLLSILGHLAYALTFSTAPVVAFYARTRRWIEGTLGVLFGVAAYKLATAKV